MRSQLRSSTLLQASICPESTTERAASEGSRCLAIELCTILRGDACNFMFDDGGEQIETFLKKKKKRAKSK